MASSKFMHLRPRRLFRVLGCSHELEIRSLQVSSSFQIRVWVGQRLSGNIPSVHNESGNVPKLHDYKFVSHLHNNCNLINFRQILIQVNENEGSIHT